MLLSLLFLVCVCAALWTDRQRPRRRVPRWPAMLPAALGVALTGALALQKMHLGAFWSEHVAFLNVALHIWPLCVVLARSTAPWARWDATVQDMLAPPLAAAMALEALFGASVLYPGVPLYIVHGVFPVVVLATALQVAAVRQ